MYDNGLLNHYKFGNQKDGFLNVSDMSIIENINMVGFRTMQCRVDGSPFYMKLYNHEYPLSRLHGDAEILLSQLYSKAGISSSIYLPADRQGQKILLCNDIEKPNIVLATNYLSKQLSYSRQKTVPFLAKDYKGVNPSRLFTSHAMQQQTKMRLLDVASYNTDRHQANFFYTLEHNAPYLLQEGQEDKDEVLFGEEIVNYFRALRPNKAKDVSAIDFESSGGNISMLLDSNYDENSTFNAYMNDFKKGVMTRPEIMREIKDSENLSQLIDKKEFAEVVGSLDPQGTAQEIEETIGYKVDERMVDVLSKAYDEMAETLLQ